MANPFSVQPLGGLQNIQMIGQGMQGIGENIQQQRQKEQQQALMQQAAEVFERGNPQEIAQFSLQNPEIGEALQGSVKFANEATRENMKQSMQQIISGRDPAEVIQRRAEMVRAQGGDPSDTLRDLELAQQDPEAYRDMVSREYALMFGEEGVPGMDGGSGGGFGTVNPRDFTPESLAKFARTQDYGDLVRYESQRSVDIGGVPHVFDPRIGGYRPASMMGTEPTSGASSGTVAQGSQGAQPAGQPSGVIGAEDVARSRETIVAAEERARLNSALAKEGYRLNQQGNLEPIPGGEPAQEQEAAQAAEGEQKRQAYEKADVMTNKIDAALDQVDWSSAGAIGQFLQFVGGTGARDLSANLETIQANLGFDALQDMRDASPTGGALGQVTEKEIRFLQGLIESLDQAQSPEQLRSNLQQLRKGVQKTRGMISGDIAVVESEEEIEQLPDGAEYVVADDPARSVRLKGGAANIMQMNRQQLDALNPADMTDEQLQQAARRYDQLGTQ